VSVGAIFVVSNPLLSSTGIGCNAKVHAFRYVSWCLILVFPLAYPFHVVLWSAMRYANVSQVCNFFVTDERLLARELCLSHYGILFPICKLFYYCWAYDFCFLAYSAFPRSYFVIGAQWGMCKRISFSHLRLFYQMKVWWRESCVTVVQVSRPCHQYRNCV
jgi:hypothetical protein